MKLKELRKNKNLTQLEVAKILNIQQATYSGYESEKFEPTLETLIKLADYYHISLDELVGRPTSLINKMLLSERERSIIEKVLNMNEEQQKLTELFIDTFNKSI